MSLEVSDRLEHIFNETIYLIEIGRNLTCKEDIERDETLKRSVVRSLEVIGEATKTLPEKLLQNHENIDWRNISRMRDNLIHPKFRTVAIFKIERILSYSDFALQLKSNNTSRESYLKSIIESLDTTEEDRNC